MPRSRTFTHVLWSGIQDIFEAILRHSFIKGLTDGSLDRDSFRFYILQDSLYLRGYARALSILASRAPEAKDAQMFNTHASGVIEVELALHRTFLRDFRISRKEARHTPMAPTNLAYTSYLLSVAQGRPFHEGVAAVLPCYWIYWEVGKRLIRKGSPDPLHQRWIDTYGGEEFGRVVREVLALTNRVGKEVDADSRSRMAEHFVTTSRYEWMFWDMGYRQEAWPI